MKTTVKYLFENYLKLSGQQVIIEVVFPTVLKRIWIYKFK